MKKIKKLLLMFIASAMIIAFAGCKTEPDEHTHTFAESWTSDEKNHWHEATCEHTTEVSGKEKHKWDDGKVTVAPTCTNSGIKTFACTVCEKEKTESLSKLKHDWDEGIISKEPTAENDCEKTFICKTCGKEETRLMHIFADTWSYNEKNHWHAATCGHNVKSGEAPHIKDESTETIINWKKTYKCKFCNAEMTEDIHEFCSSPVDAETGNAATSASKYIYFGVFPKTVLATDSAVTVDETVSVIMGANTYYKGSDGSWYSKVIANPYDSSYMYSDGTAVTSDTDRYFKVEPIKWKVLTTDFNETGKALLFAEDILTANVPYYDYNSSSNTRTVESDSNIYPNNYKYSQIRAYLNGLDYYYDESSTSTVKKTEYMGNGFLQTAFSETAQSLIAETEVDNSADSTTDSDNMLYKATEYACENTKDKIFLLSEYELTTADYGFAGCHNYGIGNTRIRVATDYAMANYACQSTTDGYGSNWWLRTPTQDISSYAHYVPDSGNAANDDPVNYMYYGVVPALTISLK